ncbi:MAG: PAS-domain containing protein, partial [Rhodovibrionaceae bacterium]
FLWAGALWLWDRHARQAARSRARLIDSERRFRDVAETAGDWIWETDAELRFTYLSERLEQVAGIGRGDVIGRNRLELARDGSSSAQWLEHARDLEARRAFRDFRFNFHAPDGRRLDFLVSGRPVYDDAGRFTGYRGTGRDATKEVNAQNRIAEQHRILKATLENMSQGISVVDADLNLIAYNSRFVELLEFPEGRFALGDSFEKFIRYNAERGEYGVGDVERLVRERVELAKRFEPHSFQRSRPDGRVLQVQGAPLPGGGMVTVYSDITQQERSKLELRQAVETAEQADRAKSQFLANMSHELRTPLNAIIGFSDLMRQEMLGPIGNPAYREYLDDIQASGRHLLAVIADILDLSRIEADRLEIDREEVQLAEVVEDALRLLSAEAQDAGVEVIPHLASGLPPVLGDRKRLCQILVNL